MITQDSNQARKPPAHAVGQPQPLPGYLAPRQALYEAQRPFAGLRSIEPSGGIAWRSCGIAKAVGVNFLDRIAEALNVGAGGIGQRHGAEHLSKELGRLASGVDRVLAVNGLHFDENLHDFSPSNISVKPARRPAGLRGRLGGKRSQDFVIGHFGLKQCITQIEKLKLGSDFLIDASKPHAAQFALPFGASGIQAGKFVRPANLQSIKVCPICHFRSPQSRHHRLETENGRLLTHRQGEIVPLFEIV